MPDLEALSTVPPNSLIRFLNSDVVSYQAGLWFRQQGGVVAPDGSVPRVWADPEVDLVETVEYVPSRDITRWQNAHRPEVFVLRGLRTAHGKSRMITDEQVWRSERWSRPIIRTALSSLIDEGLLVHARRFNGDPLSEYTQIERGFSLTSLGMAAAIRRGVDHIEPQKRGIIASIALPRKHS